MIPESRLEKYLEDGFEAFLPNDLSTGKANTEEIVADFITYRKSVENCVKSGDRSSDCDSHAYSSLISDYRFELNIQPQHCSTTVYGQSDRIPHADSASSLRLTGSDGGSSLGSRNFSRDMDGDDASIFYSETDDACSLSRDMEGDDASIHCYIDDALSIHTDENMEAGETIIEDEQLATINQVVILNHRTV